jgi:hypothetical protein
VRLPVGNLLVGVGLAGVGSLVEVLVLGLESHEEESGWGQETLAQDVGQLIILHYLTDVQAVVQLLLSSFKKSQLSTLFARKRTLAQYL